MQESRVFRLQSRGTDRQTDRHGTAAEPARSTQATSAAQVTRVLESSRKFEKSSGTSPTRPIGTKSRNFDTTGLANQVILNSILGEAVKIIQYGADLNSFTSFQYVAG